MMSTFTTFIQYSIRNPTQRISQEKEMYPDLKEVKLLLFTDMISYVKPLKNNCILLDLINSAKLQGKKIKTKIN